MFKSNDNQCMDVDYFNEMVNFLSSFVPNKTNIEEYKCFRFKENKVFVGDTDFCARYTLDDCNFGDRRFAISAKVLIGLANKLNVENQVKFELKDDNILIKSGLYTGKFPILTASEFNEFNEPIKTSKVPHDLLGGITFLSNSRSKKVHEAKRALLLGATLKGNCGYTTNMNMISKYEFDEKDELLDFIMPHTLFDMIKKNKLKPSEIGFDDRFIYVYYGNSICAKCKRYATTSENYVDLKCFYDNIYTFDDMVKIDASLIDIISSIERLKIIKGSDGLSKLKITLLNSDEFKIENIDGNARSEEIISCEAVVDKKDSYQAVSNADNLLYLFSQYKEDAKDKEDSNVSFYLSNTGKKMIISNNKKSNVISCIKQ